MYAIVLALIMLTSLDGGPIWVESSAVVIIRPAHGGKQCAATVGAAVRIGSTGLCVRETAEEIRKKIEGAK